MTYSRIYSHIEERRHLNRDCCPFPIHFARQVYSALLYLWFHDVVKIQVADTHCDRASGQDNR